MSTQLLWASMPFATIGMVAFIVYTFNRQKTVFAWATLSSLAVFLCLSAALVLALFDSETGLIGLHGARYVIFAWTVMLIYFLIEFQYRIRLLGSIVMPLALGLSLLALPERHGQESLVALPAMPTVIHVALIFVGFALNFLASAAAVMFLLKSRDLKSKTPAVLTRGLPALNTLDRLMRTTFNSGFPILTAGMLLGIAYAGSVLHDNWAMEIKIIWASLNWLMYAVLFVLHHAGRLSEQMLAKTILVLFFFIVSSFLFTNHNLPKSPGDIADIPQEEVL